MKRFLWLAIPVFISSCDYSDDFSTKDKDEIDKLVNRSLNNMVVIKGGTFQMGDFGRLIGEKLPLTGENDNKPLHDVTLSDFSIGKYKVTYKDYDIYTEVTGKDKLELPKVLKSRSSVYIKSRE